MHHRLPTPLYRVFSSLICLLLICGALLSPSSRAVTEDLKIPNLGESSTSLFSADYEYQLGRMWLRSFRGRRRFSTIHSCTAIWKIWFRAGAAQ